MLSIQHVMLETLNEDCSNRKMAAVIFPDAIRKYTKHRQLSHFEKGSNNVSDTSWFCFNRDMKSAEKSAACAQKHLSSSIVPAAIGEDTSVHEFIVHNKHLDKEMFDGILIHLTQDVKFDKFIRNKIDCSGKYEDLFVFNGEKMDSKAVRGFIGDIEQRGIYVLAHELYEKKGIICNQQWFADNIKPILESEYSEDLADTTFGFMKIRPDINELITNKDWSHLDNYVIKKSEYLEMYNDVMGAMSACIARKHRNPDFGLVDSSPDKSYTL